MPIFSKEESKVKVVIYFLDGGGTRFYSIIKENKKPWETIANKMTRRILKGKYDLQFKRAIFYDNFTDQPFKTVIGLDNIPSTKTPDNFCPEASIVKATLIDMNHKPKVYYSRLEEEKKLGYDPIEIRAAMRKRLHQKFEYRTLEFEFRAPTP